MVGTSDQGWGAGERPEHNMEAMEMRSVHSTQCEAHTSPDFCPCSFSKNPLFIQGQPLSKATCRQLTNFKSKGERVCPHDPSQRSRRATYGTFDTLALGRHGVLLQCTFKCHVPLTCSECEASDTLRRQCGAQLFVQIPSSCTAEFCLLCSRGLSSVLFLSETSPLLSQEFKSEAIPAHPRASSAINKV